MARQIHLFADRAENQFIQGLNAANPSRGLRVAQEDELQFFVHSVERNPAKPAVPAFVERPLAFAGMRASIGYIDAAAHSGTFRWRVGVQTSALLTWPQTTDQIAAWKGAALAALKGLSNVGANGVRLDDPASTPAHFFNFTWTDPARTDEIEVVENRLVPLIEVTRSVEASTAGYTQLLKLAQYPVAMTINFARPQPPEVLVIETNPGSAGVNAEQTIVIPPTAIGSVSFSRPGGANTKTMSVATMTAASLQAALLDLVADGGTNPSFRVEARPDRDGKRFAVEFRGPLARSAQPLLGKTMHDQEALPYAVGTIDLKDFRLRVDRALNGKPEVPLTFELVIDAPGEETFLHPIVIENDMTSVQTAQNAEEQGGVINTETTVYVASDDLVPYVEASPGISYVPDYDAESFVIPHNLGTWHPQVRISRKVSLTPERWEQMPDDEFTALSTSINSVTVDFDLGALSDDPLDPNYFGNFKMFISSPDSRIITFSHQHDFDGVRENLPDGLTLRAKLAAIEAAIGMSDGSLDIPAGNIAGLISPDQIDLAALCEALKTSAAFRALLLATISDSSIIDRIALALRDSAKFLETLKAMLTNSELLKALIEALSKEASFSSMLRELLMQVLQGGAQLPDGTIPFVLAAYERTVPSVHQVSGPTKLVAGSGTTTKEVTSEDERTKVSSTLPNTEIETSEERIYEHLPRALVTFATGATVTGRVSLSDFAENQIRAAIDVVRVRSIGDRRGTDYPAGTVLGRRNGIIFPVRLDGAVAWPLEYEQPLWSLPALTDDLFSRGSQFVLPFQVQAQMEGGSTGQIELVIEAGVPATEAVSTYDLHHFTWSLLALPRDGGADYSSQRLPLGEALGVHSFELKIIRAANGTMTGELKRWGRVRAFTVPALPFALRGRLLRGDTEDAPNARGALTVRRPATVASIAAL